MAKSKKQKQLEAWQRLCHGLRERFVLQKYYEALSIRRAMQLSVLHPDLVMEEEICTFYGIVRALTFNDVVGVPKETFNGMKKEFHSPTATCFHAFIVKYNYVVYQAIFDDTRRIFLGPDLTSFIRMSDYTVLYHPSQVYLLKDRLGRRLEIEAAKSKESKTP